MEEYPYDGPSASFGSSFSDGSTDSGNDVNRDEVGTEVAVSDLDLVAYVH